MSDLTRQQLCVQLSVSESTIRRLENEGMPFKTVLGMRRKVYSLQTVLLWAAQARPAISSLIPALPRNYYGGNARAKMLKRMPPWVNKADLRPFYAEARRLSRATGIPHHVDHIIPLQGDQVSGLHVPQNLQVIPGSENSKKRNRYEVDL